MAGNVSLSSTETANEEIYRLLFGDFLNIL